MKILLNTLILSFLLISISYADSWRDPSWAEILKAESIALVEYASDGKFRARAIVLKVYKGSVKPGEEIWLTNFSNRYGPIDKMSKGDRFLVFVGKIKYRKKDEEYWQNRIKRDSSSRPYVEAVKQGSAYYVQTPTSGDLKVKGNKVQYDLLQTSYYRDQEYYDLSEFERFLKNALQKKPKKSFIKYLKKRCKTLKNDYHLAQYLMMLQLIGDKSYETFYEKLLSDQQIGVRYALAQLLGNQKSKKHRNLLVRLLADTNSIVQGEVVRQLKVYPKEFIGPILLKRLGSSGDGGIYPGNLMDPVRNEIDGGKVQIIKTLGDIKYTPAGKKLLPLLETKNEYFFRLVYETLRQMGVKDYVPYFNKVLRSGNRNVSKEVVEVVSRDSIVECIPAVMEFIKKHKRYEHPTIEGIISTYNGLGRFNSDTVKNFLRQDFIEVLQTSEGDYYGIDNQGDWVEEYLDVCTEKSIFIGDKGKILLYNFLYDRYGLNQDYKVYPSLFKFKKRKEDSLRKLAYQILKGEDILRINTLAFVKLNSSKQPVLHNYTIQYVLKPNKDNKFDELGDYLETFNQKFIKNGVLKKHLVAAYGSSSHLYEARSIEPISLRQIGERFLNYICLFPDRKDIEFINNLLKYKYYTRKYDREKIQKKLEAARKRIKD
ncbi:hypothetical protein BKI52_45300 [marine bacterium AO1-C]|nr:hypothetical protein BKI52_45300 [marine bacterium AO1-C]